MHDQAPPAPGGGGHGLARLALSLLFVLAVIAMAIGLLRDGFEAMGIAGFIVVVGFAAARIVKRLAG